MKTHREGKKIILTSLFLLAGIIVLSTFFYGSSGLILSLIVTLSIFTFIIRFFRIPKRKINKQNDEVYSPADGKIVAVEEVIEDEYLHGKTIKISIFMSVWNVHINWYPCSGEVIDQKYHPGKYLVARHPKSSKENERQTILLKKDNTNIVIRQIAGIVARRVVCYAKKGAFVNPGDELGFIKFGSRVDIFLPLQSEIKVRVGQKVKGINSPIAMLKKD